MFRLNIALVNNSHSRISIEGKNEPRNVVKQMLRLINCIRIDNSE